MPTKTLPDRMDRLEQVVQILAEDQVVLQKLIANLASETEKGFALEAVRAAETDRRIAEHDRQREEFSLQIRKTDERFRKTDERIEKLVLAIGQLIVTKR